MLLRKEAGICITLKLATLFMLSDHYLELWLLAEKLLT